MKTAQLVFIPFPGIGHLASTVELAKLLVARDDRLFITVLVMNLPLDSKNGPYTKSLSSSSSMSGECIKFVDLPPVNIDTEANPMTFLVSLVEDQKPHVRNVVNKLMAKSDSSPLAGLVVDMFCTTMLDVANEFGVPTYMFFTSNAGFLGLMLHLQDLHDEQNVDTTELKNDPDAELVVPCFFNPVPAKVLPSLVLDHNAATHMFNFVRQFREMKGILVNTFVELESYAIHSLYGAKSPAVYPVGPILNLDGDQSSDIVTWLDDQPATSVVFLCFGSMGHLSERQVKEIACALEHSGLRFLWSLRQPPPKDKLMGPSDYADFKEVLPQGFLDRTDRIGKVTGWAPQVRILSHPAIGGFVSHCGWNSIMESLWYGVPIATWPLYAEQQMNAFEMVRELGLAVEIKLDYRREFTSWNDLTAVSAQEIEEGLRKLMVFDSDIRKRVKKMSQKSRMASINGGSPYSSLNHMINDVMDSLP
ncbi:hypothetical protein FNV43_RR14760 [Rhamnella rubrinervis]|uniref:Glycosyltransferase n=1 Tax=Rhamnella rubrinervis TaxID=2594499 RepID=A0A8K0H3E1_9ROSA|nr:hypothetical protein FNV43_RR14760 [Rhamnella rubrinervis]